MRKGPVFLGIGVLLVLLAVPTGLAGLLYEKQTAEKSDFNIDEDFDYGDATFTYTFKDIGPGEIKVSARGLAFFSTALDVEILDKGGDPIKVFVLTPGALFSNEESVDIDEKGDYTVKIYIEEGHELIEFQATYTSNYWMFGLFSLICAMPLFLLAGIISMVVGFISFRREMKGEEEEEEGVPEEEEIDYDHLDEWDDELEDEYEPPPRRKREYGEAAMRKKGGPKRKEKERPTKKIMDDGPTRKKKPVGKVDGPSSKKRVKGGKLKRS
ncbi:MAG: hypothetical protein ACMUIE_10575 [Thermoplasmatota archaeon]